MNSNHKTIELHKILAMLAEKASNPITKEKALSIKPSSDFESDRSEAEFDGEFPSFLADARTQDQSSRLGGRQGVGELRREYGECRVARKGGGAEGADARPRRI